MVGKCNKVKTVFWETQKCILMDRNGVFSRGAFVAVSYSIVCRTAGDKKGRGQKVSRCSGQRPDRGKEKLRGIK
jgi:hypothetical protein